MSFATRAPRPPRVAAALMAGLLLLPVAATSAASTTAGGPAPAATTTPTPPPIPPLPPCVIRNQRSGITYSSLAPAVAAARSGDSMTVQGGCRGTAVTIDRNLTLKGLAGPGGAPTRGWLIGTKGAPVLRIAAGKTVSLDHIVLTRGRALTTTDGGAITNAGALTLTRSIVRGNLAIYGGGILTTGTTTVSGSRIIRNIAFEFGGGLAVPAGGSVTVTSGSLVRVNAAGNGGGAWVKGALSLYSQSAFLRNLAGRASTPVWDSPTPFEGYGGGLFVEGTLVLGQAVGVLYNAASSEGGGIWWSNVPSVPAYCTTPLNIGNRVQGLASACDAGTEAAPAP